MATEVSSGSNSLSETKKTLESIKESRYSSMESQLLSCPRSSIEYGKQSMDDCNGIVPKRFPQGAMVPPFVCQDFKVVGHSTIAVGPDRDLDQSSVSKMLDNRKNHFMLVTGAAGTGKNMLTKQLVYLFQSSKALHTFDNLLVFSDRDNEQIFEAENLQILRVSQRFQEPISQQLITNSIGSKWLIIIHQCGIDFSENLCSVLKMIIGRKILPESTILFICRPYHVTYVETITKIDSYYTLKGLTELGRDQYLKLHGDPRKIEPLKLLDSCTNPLICQLLVRMFTAGEFEPPKSVTSLLYRIVTSFIFRYLDADERASIGSAIQVRLDSLPEGVDATFEAICLLAKEHLLRGHKCIDREESQQFLSSFSLKLSAISMKDVFRFGLVDVSLDSKYAYQFVDEKIVEFLAGFYLHKQQPPLNQLLFLYKDAPKLVMNGFTLWLQVFFGLVGEDYPAHIMYNPTKLMINTVVDVLIMSLELNYESENRYTLIKCVHEFQEKSQFRKLAARHPAVLSLSVSVEELKANIQPTLSLINKSACSEWTINTSSDNRDLVLRLQQRARGVSISIKMDDFHDHWVYLSPKLASADVNKMYRDMDSTKPMLSAEQKTEKFNQFCCRAVREILQRVLPIYSEVKIKGDATNLSYVSFLTCKCFEGAFLKHVKLSPLQPIHFLPGPKKDLSKTPPKNLNATDRHNLLKHNGESLEVVIMLRPMVQRIEGVVPVTNEEFTLILSHDLVLEFSDPIGSDMVAVEQCVEDFMIDSSHTERILPVLPIVQKTIYGRSRTAYPKPFLPPVQTPGVEPILQPIIEEVQNHPQSHVHLPDTSQIPPQVPLAAPQAPTDEYPLSDHFRINGLSHAQAVGGTSVQPSQGVFVQNFAEQAGAEARVHQAVTSRRQTALRPGTVLFTSMPEKIPSDRIQPLPLQHSLIRKGGNGSIFSENLAGTALAVKKTSYRSKEYAILTKLHHKNIIPLLAYVWGEEHAESRRRYYVYHYLPKLSGDLARLVTDKEELSLYEFHKEHQYTDLKAMGAALGNIKYILSQVLEALKYLHTSHIAHRDLKASNVLIKFFCACENPLVCSCEVKYQVVVCDFDAAIELDSNECAPATSSSQFEIVPVGTNGFRSPESSMHTLANTPEVFSPLLSTKTDIYSFGILAMRLMISTDTPYSQRSMAMLLLYYHQLKGECTGRITDKPSQYHKLDRLTKQKLTGRKWLNFLRIGEDKVLKILKLNKLRSRMKWLRGGYEFVKQCLSVDPEARPTAGGLLVDPFLNWLASTCTMNHTSMMS